MIIGGHVEYCVERDEFRLIEEARTPVQPLSLYVAPTDQCALNCRYCFAKTRPREHFDFPRFLSALEAVDPWLPLRVVVTGGEPLDETCTGTLIAELGRRGVPVTLATSLIGKVSALSVGPVAWFDVSIPAARQEVYRLMRGGGDASCVLRRIRELADSGARVRASVPLVDEAIEYLPETVQQLLEAGARRVKFQAMILPKSRRVNPRRLQDAYERVRDDLLAIDGVTGPEAAVVPSGILWGYLYLLASGELVVYSTEGDRHVVARTADITGRETHAPVLQTCVAAQLSMFRVRHKQAS